VKDWCIVQQPFSRSHHSLQDVQHRIIGNHDANRCTSTIRWFYFCISVVKAKVSAQNAHKDGAQLSLYHNMIIGIGLYESRLPFDHSRRYFKPCSIHRGENHISRFIFYTKVGMSKHTFKSSMHLGLLVESLCEVHDR